MQTKICFMVLEIWQFGFWKVLEIFSKELVRTQTHTYGYFCMQENTMVNTTYSENAKYLRRDTGARRQRVQKCHFYAVYGYNFLTFSSYICFLLRLDLLLSSGIHHLPRNVATV